MAKLQQTEEKVSKHSAAVRRGNKGFSVAEDPIALAWYDDKTGAGEIGPEKPWQQKRYVSLVPTLVLTPKLLSVVRPNKKRQKMTTYERSELKYEQKEEKRVWYWDQNRNYLFELCSLPFTAFDCLTYVASCVCFKYSRILQSYEERIERTNSPSQRYRRWLNLVMQSDNNSWGGVYIMTNTHRDEDISVFQTILWSIITL